MSKYIYEYDEWPYFTWDSNKLLNLVSEVRNLQGQLTGKMDALGFNLQNEAFLETLSQDVIKSSEIEGEILDNDQVRSSIARRLGMDISGLVESDRNVDGVVEMMLDATQKFNKELTEDRLFGWHSSLFPSGRSGMYKIIVGNWRDDSTGPMQVISGPMGREEVHFQPPNATKIQKEMDQFLNWFNKEKSDDPVLKAAIAHLWFITIHPFEDGNGRMARAITDLTLSRSEKRPERFYSMSTQIRNEKKQYYGILETTQKNTPDITDWLEWFLLCLKNAIIASDEIVQKVMIKHKFWNENKSVPFNERQIKIINMLFNTFFGNLTTTKWAKINKCSPDTALRDIHDLINKKILKKQEGGGRSTSYEIIKPSR